MNETQQYFAKAGANHAFFNDTGTRYHAEAAGAAWVKVLEWFGKYLA